MAPVALASTPARGRVVVVEDDDAIRGLLQDVLQDEGYICESESTAGAGLQQLDLLKPDVLILDIVLGGTASGWQLLDELGRNPYTADLAVIVCSADAVALGAHEIALRERGIRILPKPFDVQDLVGLVEEAVTEVRGQSRQEARRAPSTSSSLSGSMAEGDP